MIVKHTDKNLHIIILFRSVHTLAYGANIMTKQFELCKFELLTSVI